MPAADFASRPGEDMKQHAWVAHCATVYAHFLCGEGQPVDPHDPDSAFMFPVEEDVLRELIGASRATLPLVRGSARRVEQVTDVELAAQRTQSGRRWRCASGLRRSDRSTTTSSASTSSSRPSRCVSPLSLFPCTLAALVDGHLYPLELD